MNRRQVLTATGTVGASWLNEAVSRACAAPSRPIIATEPAFPRTGASRVQAFRYPPASPRSPAYRVWVNGQEVFAYRTSAGTFAAFACDGAVNVEIETTSPPGKVCLAPGRHALAAGVDGNRITLPMRSPLNLSIGCDGTEPLFLFASRIDDHPPSAAGSGVRRFEAGRVHHVGELRLRSHETVYIEGGAVVRGCIRATSSRDVRIAGPGILDGSQYPRGDARRTIILEACHDSRVEDVVMVEPSGCMITLGACEDVTVRNVRQLGGLSQADGVNVIGSRHIRVEGCFCRSGGDCVAVKSMDLRGPDRDVTLDFSADVADVDVTGCTFSVHLAGSPMEIGHELRTASVRDVRFRKCDVIKSPHPGSLFGIHNGDRSMVTDVLFEDIRVEPHNGKLVDLRIIESRGSRDKTRGQIRNVTLRNIDVAPSASIPGHTTSLIAGFDPQHTVEHVRFERFRVNGQAARGPEDLNLYLRHAGDVTFA